MREYQRHALTERVAGILDEPAPHAVFLEHARTLYGATRDELTEIVANLDGAAAAEYEKDIGEVSKPRNALKNMG